MSRSRVLTTVGIGGPARAFARPETVADLRAASRLGAGGKACARRCRPGFERARGGHRRRRAGRATRGRASRSRDRRPAARRRRWGAERRRSSSSSCRRPGRDGVRVCDSGTAGGGVRMNAGAYERDWSDIVERALVVTADEAAWLSRDELDFQYRHSVLGARPGRGAGGVPPSPTRSSGDQTSRRRTKRPSQGHAADQPPEFGSVFKNPDHALGAGPMLDACGLKGYTVGGARISPKTREFHRERGGRNRRGCSGAHGRGPSASPRAVRRRARARSGVARRPRPAARRRAAMTEPPLVFTEDIHARGGLPGARARTGRGRPSPHGGIATWSGALPRPRPRLPGRPAQARLLAAAAVPSTGRPSMYCRSGAPTRKGPKSQSEVAARALLYVSREFQPCGPPSDIPCTAGIVPAAPSGSPRTPAGVRPGCS